MLQSIKQLYGKNLGAKDGEIGQVKDFYFDDQSWAVRYVIADTGSWLLGQQVLLSPHAFSHLQQVGNSLSVNLTRKQIENSPSIEAHKPVSRQYEKDYYEYYGWPFYWQGDGLWGSYGFPNLALPPITLPSEPPPTTHPKPKRADAHLRSTQSVDGYHIQALNGPIGRVCDFIIDERSWAIRQLVVKIGHFITGTEVQIPTSHIDRISYKESTVFVNLTKEAIEQNPGQPTGSDDAAD